MVGWLGGGLAGWMVGWLVAGWWAGWMVSWLAGWLGGEEKISCRTNAKLEWLRRGPREDLAETLEAGGGTLGETLGRIRERGQREREKLEGDPMAKWGPWLSDADLF